MRLTQEQIDKMDDKSLIEAVEQDMIGGHLINNLKFWVFISAVMIGVYFTIVKLPPIITDFVNLFYGLE